MMTEHIAVARASFRRNLGQKADREGGAFRVQERAEVHRLFHRERCPKAAIAERLGMSRTTVYRLLALTEPPRYNESCDRRCSIATRPRSPSWGAHDPQGLPTENPRRVSARPGTPAHQLPPGEIGHGDWWEPPLVIPVGKSRTRRPYGFVTTLPHSAAHAVVFSFHETMPHSSRAAPVA